MKRLKTFKTNCQNRPKRHPSTKLRRISSRKAHRSFRGCLIKKELRPRCLISLFQNWSWLSRRGTVPFSREYPTTTSSQANFKKLHKPSFRTIKQSKNWRKAWLKLKSIHSELSLTTGLRYTIHRQFQLVTKDKHWATTWSRTTDEKADLDLDLLTTTTSSATIRLQVDQSCKKATSRSETRTCSLSINNRQHTPSTKKPPLHQCKALSRKWPLR